MAKTIRRLRAAGVLVLCAAAAAPAAADWLVLTDGSRVETRGPWEVRGGLLVFTLPNGTLSSLRASEADLEASREATAEAARPPAPPPPEPPRPKARVVLTEKDLPTVVQPSTAGGSAADGEAAEGEEAAAEAEPSSTDPRLTVIGWEAATPDDFDGTVVTGRIRNVSEQLLTRVAIQVLVYNASGTLLGRAPAEVEEGPLAPERITDFTARFPTVFGVTAARFDVRGRGFLEGEGTAAEEAQSQGASAEAQ